MEIPEGPFALLRREGRDHVELLTGTVETVASLAALPLREAGCADPVRSADGADLVDGAGPDVLALVPYRQVRERGFEAVDDGATLQYLRIEACVEAPVDEVLAALPAAPPRVRDGAFDVSDEAYAATVGAVLRDEIGRGEGSNFVIHRVFEASVDGEPLTAALAAFARLLRDERGAYWTFLVHTGSLTFVGATPERHVVVDDGLVMMNPISGTYRHPAGGPDRDELLAFLADRKEIDELYMVLDEELKMMATVADQGGQVVGPYLKQMAHLTHTEYLLVGRGSKDVREVLRDTMFAPTVVGSPIENACRVVARHERRGRGYYGGVLALIGRDSAGRQTLDAPILIRTAVVSADGSLRVPVGATLVRDSTPAGEVAETHAKAAGVMAALGLRGGADAGSPALFVADSSVREALARRNATLASFWLCERAFPPVFSGRRVLVVDAEDSFTGMLAHQLRALGFSVTLRSYREDFDCEGFDLVVVGPGPGDPGDLNDPKILRLDRLVRDLLAARQPMLAICLGHQVLAHALGLKLHRRNAPYQGMQRSIDFFGRSERVGFYSTYTALYSPLAGVDISRDPRSGEVHALRGTSFAGVQFHPESVLTEHGVDLLRELVGSLLHAGRSPVAR